jgi:hypothetical protein
MSNMENRILTTTENLRLPHIHYTNPTHKIDRKLYMETQFKQFKLKYTRIDMPGPEVYYEKYQSRMTGSYSSRTSYWINYASSLIVEYLSEWYHSNDEPYILLMEDDYDLSLIDKWKFSWNEFLDHIPYDWDCIQIGFECPNIVSFYLHPVKSEYSLGAVLLRREYVEKLLDLHYPNKRFKFDYKLADSEFTDRESGIHDGLTYDNTSGGPDYFLYKTGRCYSIPMIPINPYLCGISHDGISHDGIYNNLKGKSNWNPKLTFVKCYEAYHDWWNNDRDYYSLDDLFTYGKKHDILMQRDISVWDDKYFYNKALLCREELLKLWN